MSRFLPCLLAALAVTPSCASVPAPTEEAPQSAPQSSRDSAVPPLPSHEEPESPSAGVADSGDADQGTANPKPSWAYYRGRYDADGDGTVTREEYTRSEIGFRNLDADQDGRISGSDFARRWERLPRPGGHLGGYYVDGAPRLDRPAPGFHLTSTTGEHVDLAQFRGVKPVVLVFGSFT